MVLQKAQGDLGGIEELSAPILRDRAGEDSMGGAGDEIADPVCAGEHGYCITLGPASRFGCVDFDPEFTFVFFGVGLMGALPGRGATADGSFCVGWIGAGARSEGGWGPDVFGVLDECFFFEGCIGHAGNLLQIVCAGEW